jgi:predicted nuclease of predicted toxin-antitoxin system
MVRPKFIADADLSRKIVFGVRRREPAIDFLTAREEGTLGLTDPEVLALAAASGRVVVSSDQNAMLSHFRRFREAHDSPGLVIVRQSIDLARAIDELILIWNDPSPELLRNDVNWVRSRK